MHACLVHIVWTCGYLCLWPLCRQGLPHVLQVLLWTASRRVTVGTACPGIMKPLGAQDPPWRDGRVPYKHTQLLNKWWQIVPKGLRLGYIFILTCKPADELRDALCDLLFRQCLHIFWLMPSNPSTQNMSIPEILRHKQDFVPNPKSCQLTSISIFVPRGVTDLSVGFSTVKPNNFFIQDLCTSGTWSSSASWTIPTK